LREVPVRFGTLFQHFVNQAWITLLMHGTRKQMVLGAQDHDVSAMRMFQIAIHLEGQTEQGLKAQIDRLHSTRLLNHRAMNPEGNIGSAEHDDPRARAGLESIDLVLDSAEVMVAISRRTESKHRGNHDQLKRQKGRTATYKTLDWRWFRIQSR
jgi:hypothetical protein